MSQAGKYPRLVGGALSPRFLKLPLYALVTGALIFSVACGGGKSSTPKKELGTHAGLQTDAPTPEATISLDRPAVTPVVENLASVTADDHFLIPGIGVDAPLSYHKVGTDGIMPNPDGEDDIAYYDFSQWAGKGGAPGKGGNAIFAGHVDSGFAPCKHGTVKPPCQSVLWDLGKVKPGDEIQLRVSGVIYKYKVTANQPVSANNGPWDTIVSSTEKESITIITCGGDFNTTTHEYTNRQVVTAERQV